jgi:hypothetical protein
VVAVRATEKNNKKERCTMWYSALTLTVSET